MDEVDINVDLHVQSLLLAAANHDIPALRNLLRNSSANVQDPETGFSPLHAAIAACETEEVQHQNTNGTNGCVNGSDENVDSDIDGTTNAPTGDDEAAALKTVKLLFQNGAIWNDLDANGETPACIAHRLGLKSVYDAVVDAGVRAELLLNRLDSYQPLDDEENDGGNEGDEEDMDDFQTKRDNEQNNSLSNANEPFTGEPPIVAQETTQPYHQASASEVENFQEKYLSSNLLIYSNRLLDSDNNAVMMSWETEIMERSAEALLPCRNLRVLNVGHGMGIIDGFFQSKGPSAHHIIEAHPTVLAKMRENGWYDKPNVTVHEGKWQDVMPKLASESTYFDAIYFDTFGEEYKDLREFFSEHVVGLLDSSVEGNETQKSLNNDDNERTDRDDLNYKAKFGFFNGLGADRQVCYDVYTKVSHGNHLAIVLRCSDDKMQIVEMDLFEAGFETRWEEIVVPDLKEAGEWEGVKRPYWNIAKYRLPISYLT